MKKEKREMKINLITNLILDWCSKKKISYYQSSMESFYLDLQKYNFDNFKEELKSYLVKESGIFNIKKYLTFLFIKERLYIIFKVKNNCYQ